MVWNSELDQFKNFGERSLRENQNHCCKILFKLNPDQIFDILYLNGKDLTNLTLSERRRQIQNIVIPKGSQINLN
jgi:ATP-dependent DNA ligase